MANAGAAGKTAVIKTKSFDTFVPNIGRTPPNLQHFEWTPGIITVHSARVKTDFRSATRSHVLVCAKNATPLRSTLFDNDPGDLGISESSCIAENGIVRTAKVQSMPVRTGVEDP